MIKKNTMIIVLVVLISIMSIGLLITKEKSLSKKQNTNSNIKENINEDSKQEESKETIPNQEESNITKDESKQEPVKGNNNSNLDTSSKEPNSNSSSDKNNNDSNVSKEETTIVVKKITIDNRCDITAQALEKIYQDNNYEYYLNTISSGCIYVNVNGVEYTLKNAIDKDIVTVYELEDNGFKFYKKERNLVSR